MNRCKNLQSICDSKKYEEQEIVTLDSIITSTTPDEQKRELEEKLIQFSPNAQAAVRSLLAKGRKFNEILLPGVNKEDIVFISPDFDEPMEEFAKYM